MSLGDIRNLDHTVLLCTRMQETKDFYLHVMGFPLAHDSERWVSFQVGSALLTLRPRGPGLRGTMVRYLPVRLPSSSPSASRHIWSTPATKRCSPRACQC
jgi:catechol 2,3-dioxygenase-like lactoylglutathione lyase family enzyme